MSKNGALKPSVENISPQERRLVAGSALKDFEVSVTVGTGTFGRVKICWHPSIKHRAFALKKIPKRKVIRLRQEKHLQSERRILSCIDHPFIVSLHRCFQEELHVYMLMDFTPGGELFSHLRRTGRFSKEFSKFYAGQIVIVFGFLHSKEIAYRDLKPENLLISHNGYLKVIDFGFAKCLKGQDTWTLCGTPEYLAPEIIQSCGHGVGVDWWALGVLIFEMMCGVPPFYDNNHFGTYQRVLTGKIDFTKHMDESVRSIVSELLAPEISQRLGCGPNGAKAVMWHKFFRGVDWNALHAQVITAPIIPKVKDVRDTQYFGDQVTAESDESDEDLNPSAGLSELSPSRQKIFKEFS